MSTITAPTVRPIVLGYCETGQHHVHADVLTPATMDPAMGLYRLPSICEACTDAQVSAYYG